MSVADHSLVTSTVPHTGGAAAVNLVSQPEKVPPTTSIDYSTTSLDYSNPLQPMTTMMTSIVSPTVATMSFENTAVLSSTAATTPAINFLSTAPPLVNLDNTSLKQ